MGIRIRPLARHVRSWLALRYRFNAIRKQIQTELGVYRYMYRTESAPSIIPMYPFNLNNQCPRRACSTRVNLEPLGDSDVPPDAFSMYAHCHKTSDWSGRRTSPRLHLSAAIPCILFMWNLFLVFTVYGRTWIYPPKWNLL
jgi:hypothetical protein